MSTTEKAGNDDAQKESSELSAPSLEDFGTFRTKPKEVEEEIEEESTEENEEEEEDDEGEESEESENESEDTEEDEGEEESSSTELDLDDIPEEDRVGLANQLLEALSPEQRKEFYAGSKGRMAKDMGKARKAKAEAEAEVESIKAKYALLEAEKTYGDNPYSTYTDSNKLDAELTNITAQIKAGRALLRGTDEEFEINGEYQSREWVDDKINEYEALKDSIPKQKEFLRNKSKAAQKAKDAEVKLSETYSWFKNEDSDEFKAYRKLIKDPTWAMALDRVPSLADKLPEVLANFVSTGKVKKSTEKRKLPTRGERKPKGNFGSGGVGSSGSNSSQRKKSKSNEALFGGSATLNDKLSMFA
jgi:hypothetical protein